MTDFKWFEAFPPRDLDLATVTGVVRVLAGRPTFGIRRLQPVVVFELWLRPDGVRWLIGIDDGVAVSLSGALAAQLPGLVLQPRNTPERPLPITARDVRFTSLSGLARKFGDVSGARC